LPFKAVNTRGQPDYQPGMQRHHLLPRQLMFHRSLAPMLDAVGRDQVGFSDFRRNGVLLPASDEMAERAGLPLHRGPHRRYNAMVAERIGQIEAGWARRRSASPLSAQAEAAMRLKLLQKALRRRLLQPGLRPIMLNRNDPLGRKMDFSELDAMVDALWAGTELPILGGIS
jgi:hypothetical protein